jgi:hypothetical protein
MRGPANPSACAGGYFPFESLSFFPLRSIRVIRGYHAFLRINQRAANCSGRLRSRLVARRCATFPFPFRALRVFRGSTSPNPLSPSSHMSRQDLAQTRNSASSSVPMRSCNAPRRNSQENDLCRQKCVFATKVATSQSCSEVCVDWGNSEKKEDGQLGRWPPWPSWSIVWSPTISNPIRERTNFQA